MPVQNGLLVINVQNGYQQAVGYDEVVAKINRRLDVYHHAHHPVIFLQRTDDAFVYGSPSWELDARLQVQRDVIVLNYQTDIFFETGLVERLRHLNINSLEVCGLQTELAVDTAIRVGHNQGFQMAIQSGLATTFATPELTAEQIRCHHERVWAQGFATVYTQPLAK
ncbi:isochorismatase family protein [Levilactobacillus enshiensis]|uniref:isochorismatase family protein n=1 Tax=Levilactobacillus enshiensis TaxID=2590213 RepID=UPI00117AE6C9|nr:isochorismatase family protein [Levilactobacillus enshiensis]